MKKHNGFTLIELIIVIAILFLFLAVFMPPLGIVIPIAKRVVCGTNLKGLGNAMTVYAHDIDGCYPQLPGNGPWAKELGFAYDNSKPDFTGAQADTPRTVTASWYLLVRLADVSPKSFICPQSNQKEFEGENPKNLDIVELWDFGSDPYPHVSYAMHNPYGKYPANNKRSAAFVIASDMSPWFQRGEILKPNGDINLPPQIINLQNKDTWDRGNSINHAAYEKKILFFRLTRRRNCGLGQNVLYVDGHTAFEQFTSVGIKQDNIYTYWSAEENPGEQDIQGGTAPTDRSPENDAKSEEDSFLAI